MRIPTSIIDLLSGLPPATRLAIAGHWKASEGATLAASTPDEGKLYELLDNCGREERWTLFDILESGGYSRSTVYPKRHDSSGERLEVDLSTLRERGLVFPVVVGTALETYLVIPTEFRPCLQQYREQLLLMKIAALRDELAARSLPHEPIILPEQIQPNLALSHLVASSDPEGFRYPLSRALSIPESFPVSVKRTLKKMLHEIYLIFLPYLGLLEADRSYPIEGLVTLMAGVSALLSQYHSRDLEPELLDPEQRPFASANDQLSIARRPLWRSFIVLFLSQFLTPIGATRTVEDDQFQVFPSAFTKLDLEVKRSKWLVTCLEEIGVPI